MGADRSAVVFGAAGFVGRNICAALDADGWSVTAVVRDPSAELPFARVLKLDVIRADLSTLIRALVTLRPAFVVNAAGALWNVTPDQMTDSNVRLVNRLVHAIATLPDPVRLVHIGSAYEYGS